MTEEEFKALQNELAAARSELAKLTEERETLTCRMTELGQVVTAKDTDITGLQENVSGLEARVKSLSQSLGEAVSSYQTLVLKTNPSLPPEMLTGDTIAAINQSVESTASLVKKLKEGLKQETAAIRVPAGAPPRRQVDLAGLSPREKIQYAIGGKK